MTILQEGVLLGPQRPRVCSVPQYSRTLGPDAARAAEIAGLDLDPWQRMALDDIMAVRDNDWPVARRAALVVPRQNGKGSCLEAYILEGLFLSNLRLITYSAHETKTSDEMFDRIRELVEGSLPFRKRLAPNGVRLANGQQQILLKSGAKLKFIARTKSSGRGFSGDRIILDEAQELQRAHMRSLVPTLATRRHAHVFMAGSTPEPDREVFPGIVETGRSGSDPGLCYLEWSVPEPEDGVSVDVSDRDLWRQANPGYGLRLFDEAILNERALLDDEGFARERLGIVGRDLSSGIFPRGAWAALRDPNSKIVADVTFAIEVSESRQWACIGAAGEGTSAVHVGSVDYREGTSWIVEKAKELAALRPEAFFVVRPGSEAGALIGDLENAGLKLLKASLQDYAQACGDFTDAVVDQEVRHLGQPALDVSVAGAKKRTSGDASVWDQRKSLDITPLAAVTLALWGHVRRPRSSGGWAL